MVNPSTSACLSMRALASRSSVMRCVMRENESSSMADAPAPTRNVSVVLPSSICRSGVRVRVSCVVQVP